jgi:hypothetical protein
MESYSVSLQNKVSCVCVCVSVCVCVRARACVCVRARVCVFPLTEENELALNAGITYYVAYFRFITYNLELNSFFFLLEKITLQLL